MGEKGQKQRRANNSSLRVALSYIVFGLAWIVLSGLYVLHTVPEASVRQSFYEISKGCVFILVTGVLLFFLVRRQLLSYSNELAARKRVEEQLEQARKMEAIGRLAGGVAHDFNNVMAVISGYSEALLRRISETDPLREAADEIARATERGAGLTAQLLAFSRRQTATPSVIDLNPLIEEICRMLGPVMSEKVTINFVPGGEHASVRIDPGQMEQVITNLLLNARDAMPGGGTIWMTSGAVDLSADDAPRYGIAPGPYNRLVVRDSGCGMDSELRARIFEPFFTTKEGKGTGLGLSIVYSIVQQAGGAIAVESEPGKGAVFEVLLPRAASNAAVS